MEVLAEVLWGWCSFFCPCFPSGAKPTLLSALFVYVHVRGWGGSPDRAGQVPLSLSYTLNPINNTCFCKCLNAFSVGSRGPYLV